MFGIIEKVRGFIQPIIRGFQAIGAGIQHTLEVFRTYAPEVEETAISEDYTAYEQAEQIQTLDPSLETDYMIPWFVHAESPVALSAQFKYDIKAVYENIEGETVEGFWSVLDDRRLSQKEIIEMGTPFKVDSPPVDSDEYPFSGPIEVIACWRRD